MVRVGLGTKGIDFDWQEGGNPIKPPPPGLEPMGDSGWYKSPDDLLPGDPLYCEYNPGSPVCGGNPFTSAGLEVGAEINIDPCGFSARIGGSIAFVKMPEHQFTYRKPGACRREYEAPPPAIPPPPLPGADFIPQRLTRPQGFGDDEYVYVVFAYYYFSAVSFYSTRYGGQATYTSFITNNPFGIEHPSSQLYNGYQHNYGEPQPASSSCFYTRQFVGTANQIFTWEQGIESASQTTTGFIAIDSRQPNVESRDNNILLDYKIADGSRFDGGSCDLLEGRFGDIFPRPYIDLFNGRDYRENNVADANGQVHEGYIVDTAWKELVYIGRKPPDPKRRPPSFPPEPRNCDCMQCCFAPPSSSNQQNNDELLKQILAECKKMNKALGSDEFPANFPQRLTGSNPGSVNIPNVAQLLKQKVIYLDELLGQYPVKVKIEDVDPTKEGNQSEELEFGNTSELLAELFGTVMNIAIDSNVTVQLVTKALMEAGLIRKQVHTSQSHLEALVKHQGFELKEKTENVPFTFTVPQTTKLNEFKLEDFCKESTQKVEVIEYKGKTTYIEDAAIIRHMHGIIKGVFFRGIAKDAASVAGEISRLLRKQGEAIDKISDNSEDGLENFIEDFERGFSSYTGGTGTVDPEKPFGLPYEQRPRVKIIKKPTTDNPGAGQ